MPRTLQRKSASSPALTRKPVLLEPEIPTSHKNGHFIVAYDIACPKRLRKIANCCLDHGFRAQYSIFECKLSWNQFDSFWKKLTQIADLEEDRLLAFPVHASSLALIRRAGKNLSLFPSQCYIF